MSIPVVRVNEESSRTITFTLKDHADVVVPLANIDTATLTLFDWDTYQRDGSPVAGVLNNRDAHDVKNANDVTIHSTSGLVTYVMQPADNMIVTERRQVERHRAEFLFVVDGAELNYPIWVEVVNMRVAR